MDLIKLLEEIDNGAQAEIISDRKPLELVSSLSKQRNLEVPLGQLICELGGGAHEILRSKHKRNTLFMALKTEQRNEISECISESDIFNFRLTVDKKLALHRLFSVEDRSSLSDDTTIDNSKIVGVSPKYGLFEHQSKALIECKTYLDSENPQVMLHMPTGSGKTRTSMHLIARYLNQSPNTLIVWLVAGKELCEQAANEFEESWSYLGERPIPLIKLWSDKSGIHSKYTNTMSVRNNAPTEVDFQESPWPLELKDGVIIASLDSLRSLMSTWEPSDRHVRRSSVSLIIFDEAHQSVAPTYRTVIETLQSPSQPYTKLIGLTATPGRKHYGGSSDGNNELVKLFGNQFVQLKIEGYTSPVDYLVENGYLAKLEKEKLTIVNQNFSTEELASFNKSISASMDVPDDILKILGYSATRNLQIVERVERLVMEEGHKRVLVFSPSVEAAIILSNICKCIGINSSFVHASSTDRDSVIRKYKANDDEARVIFNYGVLTTGFDAPKTSAVVIARPTTSLVLLNQMAGRAIRGHLVGGNNDAILITVVDIEIPVLVEPVAQFHAFDESWRINNNG